MTFPVLFYLESEMRVIIVNESSTVLVNIFTGNARLLEMIQHEANMGRLEVSTRPDSDCTWGLPETAGVTVDR